MTSMFPILRLPVVALLLAGLAACTTPLTAPPEERCPAPVKCPACALCTVCPACPACPELPPPVPTPAPPKAAQPALQPAAWGDLEGLAEDRLLEALPALRQSCAKLSASETWAPFCERLGALGEAPGEVVLRAFLEAELVPWKVVNPDGTDEGLVTGYYEPLIKGSRSRTDAARWPILGVPEDLVSVELASLYPDLKKFRLRGRLEGRSLKPYWTRAEIEAREGQLPAPVILWAEDPIELFFLQVQGSGRVELPDGAIARIGYADQNGHPYQSIGRWLVEQGELSLSQASMAGISDWARAHPQRLTEMLNANPSYVFFRELPNTNGGPIGALGVPLTEGRSIAVDPTIIPLGSPVFISTQRPNTTTLLRRLVLAQDTGGAIKGAVRADFFWGFGAQAGAEAGRMRQRGRLWVLLPKSFAP